MTGEEYRAQLDRAQRNLWIWFAVAVVALVVYAVGALLDWPLYAEAPPWLVMAAAAWRVATWRVPPLPWDR